MRRGGARVDRGTIDPKVLQALLAVEDRRFYQRHGVDVRALLRDTPRTRGGKLSQMARAVRLDAHLDKQAILEQYLNRVRALRPGTHVIRARDAAGETDQVTIVVQ